MIARRTIVASLLAGAIALTATMALGAEGRPYITAADLDLTRILPPPPADDSAQTRAELAEVLRWQVTRSQAQAERAAADAVENVWRFAEVMGPAFRPEALPVFSAFFDRVVATEGAVVDPAKDTWRRTRPHRLSDLVRPAVRISSSGSWPSGHATVGTLMGIVLADMVPERRAEIMARAREYADNRVVGGIHYPSDVEMGRISGSVIAARIMALDAFRAEQAAARAELRRVLGLTP